MSTTERPDVRILVADDHFIVRMGLVALINTEPRLKVVCEADDGLQVVALFEKMRPDLVLMDIRLPDMDGREAVRRLKADERTAGIPVVALTALAMTGDRERFLEDGFDDYLEKPISVRDFGDQIRSWLR